jgi:hypothetical protein
MKQIVAILSGHHGIGTGASFADRDEWALARGDALELYLQLTRDGIVKPVLEPIAADDTPLEKDPIPRAALWALSNKPAAVIELHYNSFDTTKPRGHCVVSNKMTSLVEAMAKGLDMLPNPHRDTIIDAGFQLPRLVDPIPCCLLEPAFIFELIVTETSWRPMLVAAIKGGIYKYFEAEDIHA